MNLYIIKYAAKTYRFKHTAEAVALGFDGLRAADAFYRRSNHHKGAEIHAITPVRTLADLPDWFDIDDYPWGGDDKTIREILEGKKTP